MHWPSLAIWAKDLSVFVLTYETRWVSRLDYLVCLLIAVLIMFLCQFFSARCYPSLFSDLLSSVSLCFFIWPFHQAQGVDMAIKTQMVMDQESLAAFQQEVSFILPPSG